MNLDESSPCYPDTITYLDLQKLSRSDKDCFDKVIQTYVNCAFNLVGINRVGLPVSLSAEQMLQKIRCIHTIIDYCLVSQFEGTNLEKGAWMYLRRIFSYKNEVTNEKENEL